MDTYTDRQTTNNRANEQTDSALPLALKVEPLTPAERETLYHVTRGLTNKEIAAEMRISDKTVIVRLTTVYQKLGIRSADGSPRLLATRYAIMHGLDKPAKK
jgi:DNA-binding NarL/FixJ family response regulator